MSLGDALGASLPNLPTLDEEDLKAVRHFLPGKLLSRTAALLSLVLLVLGTTTAIDQALKRLMGVDLSATPWLRFGLLLGLPLLAVSAQLLVEWQAERNRRARQGLAVQPGAEQSGYFRIGPYLSTAEDQASFHRVDGAHQGVLNWLEKSQYVPLYLTGDSGSGKSSLLNASVLPVLRNRGWTVVEIRPKQDPAAALRDALGQPSALLPQRQGEPQAIRNLIEAAARRAGEQLLLVLDQFEEFVILGKPEQQQKFAALLADLRSNPVKKFILLLVLRSDYQAFLEDIGLPPLRQGENLYQVNRFMFAAANDFLAHSGLKLQADAIDSLLTSAAELDETPGLVRPITLNVIGYVLANGMTSASTLEAGQLVRRYIEQTVRQPAIRDFAPKVLEQLVTEQATKRPRSEGELTASTQLGRGDVRAVLNGLSAAALARPLARPADPSGEVWELSHDFIARAVARYLGRRRRDLLQRGAFYMAPALLAAMLAIAASVIAWNSINGYRIQSELAKLGLSVIAMPGELSVVADPNRLTSDGFTLAGGLLGKLAGLKILDLNGAKVESLEPIKGLLGLHTLSLSGTAVSDLQPLKRLTGLHRLNLGDTKVEDLEPLESLTALEELVLVDTHVIYLTPIRGLNRLQTLDLGGTSVRNLEPIDRLTRLKMLLLSGTKVEDLKPLGNLTGLQRLDLSVTKVKDLEPVKSLTALRVLNLSQTRVESLEPLAGLTRLQQLDLSGTKVVDLEPLKGLTGLESLNLSDTKVQNLGPLEGLPKLQSLVLAGATVGALDPLAGLPALQVLNLNETKVEDLGPLDNLPALWLLYLSPSVSEAEQTRFNRARREKHMQAVEIRH
jgi:Leucine-rich repeat (LRR) protein